MARTYGAVYLSIWRDKDFCRLSHTEQYMYWALIFQPRLNRAGLLDYFPARWAESTGDMSTADVEVAIKGLIARRYVVLDEATHELLIRTYVRNSDVWKMPKAFASVIPAAQEIMSSKLRRVLLRDLDRIPVGELSDAPGPKDSPSVRSKIEGYIGKLRELLDDGEPDDPAGIDGDDPEPPQDCEPGTPGVSERVSVPDEYPTDTAPVPSGTRVRARLVPLPVPVPVPEPTPQRGALFDIDTPADDAADKPQPKGTERKPKTTTSAKSRGTRIPDDFAITEPMREWGRRNAPHVNGQEATDEFVDYWRGVPGAKGVKLDWIATWRNRMRELEKRATGAGNVISINRRHAAYRESDDREYRPLASAFDSTGA